MAAEAKPVAAKKAPAKSYKMSSDHKERLAEGRSQSRVIRNYLETIRAAGVGKPGRKRTKEQVEKRLAVIEDSIATETNPLNEIKLLSERDHLLNELDSFVDEDEMNAITQDFIKYAADYSEKKGITFSAWRSFGVPARVLKEAGISSD